MTDDAIITKVFGKQLSIGHIYIIGNGLELAF